MLFNLKFFLLIIVVSEESFLVSLETIYELKKEYNCEVIFIAMDNHLFAGGCRYVNECENYMNKCNNCLALKNWFKSIAIKSAFLFFSIDPINESSPNAFAPLIVAIFIA